MKKNILFISIFLGILSCGITKKDNIRKFDNSLRGTTFNRSTVSWKIDLSESSENTFGKTDYSAPTIIDEDTLVFTNKNKAYLVDYNKGIILSKKKLSYTVMSPIIKVGKNLIFFASDGEIHLVDRDFNKVWNYKLDFEKVVGSFYIEKNSIIFKTSKDKVISLGKDGKIKWTTDSYLSDFMPLLTDSKLLITNQFVFAGFSNGRFIILDKKDGKTIHEQTLSSLEQFNDIVSTPIEKNNIVYIPSFAKGIIAFDYISKEIIWNTNFPTISSLFMTSLGDFYLNNDYLVKIDSKSGKILKKSKLSIDRMLSSFLHNDRYIVITSSKKGVSLLDLKNMTNFSIDISSGVSTNPIFIDKQNIIILSNNGVLYRIRLLIK